MTDPQNNPRYRLNLRAIRTMFDETISGKGGRPGWKNPADAPCFKTPEFLEAVRSYHSGRWYTRFLYRDLPPG
jgi:hypothetical protein